MEMAPWTLGWARTPIVCGIEGCSETFTTDEAAKRHRTTAVKHAPIRTAECDLCDMAFTRKDALYRHKKLEHENPNPNRKKRSAKKAHKSSRRVATRTVVDIDGEAYTEYSKDGEYQRPRSTIDEQAPSATPYPRHGKVRPKG
ncbi:hypothetical protein SISNIDRAFT_356462 [Sistotremastrum niveocremeum HHB9708]|uniref:C2H2-type domain-containing protein n=1 Tax=Sistotremastrum niveocremeum HHB9708 TaxID=1314777 RepID=A0A164WIV4_9AGAM|nr:hypothetical protein SISNIDRAFT_356462 [Sistotremastrum niveocremeum HHB9708]